MKTNVEFFKLIDPAGQSLLFILFGYSLDSAGLSYQVFFFILGGWQLLSWAINLFMRSFKLLKTERIFYIIITMIYAFIYCYVTKNIKENIISVRDAKGLTDYPLHEILLVSAGLIIAFWYYIICFREIKAFFKKRR